MKETAAPHVRLKAALCFGAAGFVAAVLVLLTNDTFPTKESMSFWLLFTIGPTVAAGVSGALIGHRVMNTAHTSTGFGAVFYGLLITLVAIILFSLAFTAGYLITVSFRASALGGFLGWPLIILRESGPIAFSTGALASYLLFRLRS